MWQTLRGCGVQGSIQACGVEGYDFAFACDDGDGYLYWQKRGDLQPFYVWFCLGSFFFVSWQLVLFLLLAYCEPPKRGNIWNFSADFFGYWVLLCLQRISSAILLRSFCVKLSLCLRFSTSLLIQVHEFVLWELIFRSKKTLLRKNKTRISNKIVWV